MGLPSSRVSQLQVEAVMWGAIDITSGAPISGSLVQLLPWPGQWLQLTTCRR